MWEALMEKKGESVVQTSGNPSPAPSEKPSKCCVEPSESAPEEHFAGKSPSGKTPDVPKSVMFPSNNGATKKSKGTKIEEDPDNETSSGVSNTRGMRPIDFSTKRQILKEEAYLGSTLAVTAFTAFLEAAVNNYHNSKQGK